jgi:hypothetical protein
MRKPEKIKMKKITPFSSCFFFSVKNGPMTREFIFRLFGELKEYTGVNTPGVLFFFKNTGVYWSTYS